MIFAIILLFIASSFFSGSETALTAANKIKIQTRADNGDKKSQKLLKILRNTEEFIAGILISNNIPNIILPSLVTIVAMEYGLNVGVATGVLTVAMIIFAEVLPKSVAASYPDRIAYFVSPIIRVVLTILKPFTFLLNSFTHIVVRLLGRNQNEEVTFSKEEMRAMVDIGHTEGTFGNTEVYGLKGMLDFSKLNVADILQTPRIDVQGISADADFEEAREIIMKNQFSRYPVYEDNLDNIVGVFHTKFFVPWSAAPEIQVKNFTDLDPMRVHEFQHISQVFKEMLQKKKHFAIVSDEFGGTEGIITNEELIEAMIGQDIEDETDIHDDLIEQFTDNVMVSDGKITLHRLNNIFKTRIPEEEDNLAGFCLFQFGYIPQVGETFEYGNLKFEILDSDERRIKTVKIIKTSFPESKEDGAN